MNQLAEQGQILEQLCQILHDEANSGYDELQCEYRYLEDYDTIDNFFTFSIAEKRNNPPLSARATIENSKLAKQLRALMKEHTGGEWTSFTLTLDKDGRAHTKFEYPDKD